MKKHLKTSGKTIVNEIVELEDRIKFYEKFAIERKNTIYDGIMQRTIKELKQELREKKLNLLWKETNQ